MDKEPDFSDESSEYYEGQDWDWVLDSIKALLNNVEKKPISSNIVFQGLVRIACAQLQQRKPVSSESYQVNITIDDPLRDNSENET